MEMRMPDGFWNMDKDAVEAECEWLMALLSCAPKLDRFKGLPEEGKAEILRILIAQTPDIHQPVDCLVYATLHRLETYPGAYDYRLEPAAPPHMEMVMDAFIMDWDHLRRSGEMPVKQAYEREYREF